MEGDTVEHLIDVIREPRGAGSTQGRIDLKNLLIFKCHPSNYSHYTSTCAAKVKIPSSHANFPIYIHTLFKHTRVHTNIH